MSDILKDWQKIAGILGDISPESTMSLKEILSDSYTSPDKSLVTKLKDKRVKKDDELEAALADIKAKLLSEEMDVAKLKKRLFEDGEPKSDPNERLPTIEEIKDQALQAAAEDMAERLIVCDETFMLTSPEQLTVYRNGKFSKEAHMGSEDFKPLSAYLGKRGQIILTFKPIMTSSYIHMEMPLNDAKKKLSGFREYYNESLAPAMDVLENVKIEEQRIAQQEESKVKSKVYETQGWGDW